MIKKILILILLVATFFVSRAFFGARRNGGGELATASVTAIASPSDASNIVSDESAPSSTATSARPITLTNGIKHSIPIAQLIGSGNGRDGVPALGNPRYLDPSNDEFIDAHDRGIGICLETTCRFYPYKILVWHQIVNDTFGSFPVLVTYAPLTGTTVAYERSVNGEAVRFGDSGKLWQGGLVMYHQPEKAYDESLWSQSLGEAIIGPDTTTLLTVIPSYVLEYGDWLKLHAHTQVLSQDTGFVRPYGYNPYADYETSDSLPSGVTVSDRRLQTKESIIGLCMSGKCKAYSLKALPIGETKDTVGGIHFKIQKTSPGEIRIFNEADSHPIPYITSYWFAWRAIHPDTLL